MNFIFCLYNILCIREEVFARISFLLHNARDFPISTKNSPLEMNDFLARDGETTVLHFVARKQLLPKPTQPRSNERTPGRRQTPNHAKAYTDNSRGPL